MITKRALVVRIQRRLEGDLPVATESRYTENYILQFVNEAIAYFAKKSALQNSQLEGVMYASDAFNFSYKDLVVATDSATGQKYIDLPALPIDLPRNRSLVRLTPNGSYKNNTFKPISAKDVSKIGSLCMPPSITFYYLEDGKAKFISCNNVLPAKVNIVMVTGAGGLDDQLNLPPDAQAELVTYVLNLLWKDKPQDLVNDGSDFSSNGTI